jgi:hypothetical protein
VLLDFYVCKFAIYFDEVLSNILEFNWMPGLLVIFHGLFLLWFAFLFVIHFFCHERLFILFICVIQAIFIFIGRRLFLFPKDLDIVTSLLSITSFGWLLCNYLIINIYSLPTLIIFFVRVRSIILYLFFTFLFFLGGGWMK